MKRLMILPALALLVGCKTTKVAVATPVAKDTVTVAADAFTDRFYQGKNDFRTASIKASARYTDEHEDQSVTADIRIKKDEIIFISIRFIGITMAKALITPTEVKYYEKIGATYFEGDYSTLSKWLGTDLDFNRVQNLLLGEPLEDLRQKGLQPATQGNLLVIQDNSNRRTPKTYLFDGLNLKASQVTQPAENRSLEVSYPSYSNPQGRSFPAQILIDALHEKGKTNIRINYNSAAFNEELSYPYSVPEGYERVFIK